MSLVDRIRRTRSAALCLAAAACALGAAPAAAAVPTASALTPNGLATDSQGNVYIADVANAVVKKVDPAGEAITVVAGIPGQRGLPTPGPAASSRLSAPSALTIDANDNLYIADAGEDQAVLKVSPPGVLTIAAGAPGESLAPLEEGSALDAQLRELSGLAVDREGGFYLSSLWHSVVARVDNAGELSVTAGIPPTLAPPTVGGPATESRLYLPMGLTTDSNGDLYIADTGNRVVEKVDAASGILTVVAGNVGQGGAPTEGKFSSLATPTGLALDSMNNLYIADADSDVVVRVDLLTGILTVVAGTGIGGEPTAGPATESRLDGPTDLALDSAGNLFIGDTLNHRVLKVDPSGTLSIFAGSGEGAQWEPEIESTVCYGRTLSGEYDDVTVPEGATCTLDGARVLGDVKADGAAATIVANTTISGNLLIRGTKGLSVSDSEVGGDATIEDNDGPLTFISTTVAGRLILRNNNGPVPDSVNVLGNTVEGEVVCSGNEDLANECNEGGTLPAQNTAPVSADDAPGAFDEDTQLNVPAPGVLGNDTDADGDALQALEVSAPLNGSLALAADGSFAYTPDADFAGQDSFTYRATDGEESSGIATVRLDVTPVNDVPTVTATAKACAADGAGGNYDLTVGDIETAANALSVSATSSAPTVLPAAGVKLSGSGAGRSLALRTTRTGRATVKVKVSDGKSLTTIPIVLTAGGSRPDIVAGTGGADLLLGRNGSDVLLGLAGDDLACGGNGNDLLLGGDGDDSLDGGAGFDLLFGGNGADRLTGGTGPDFFSGGPGEDIATDRTPSHPDLQDGT